MAEPISTNPAPESGDARIAPQLSLRAREAACPLGISTRLLRPIVKRGEIPYVRLGRAVVYPANELRRRLAELVVEGARV